MVETDEIIHAKLFKILGELSEGSISEDLIASYIERFSSIYTADFRHMYSRFYPWIVETASKADPGVTNTLADNLWMIYENFPEDKDKPWLKKSIFKLYDHINLEIARYDQQKKDMDMILDVEKNMNNIANDAEIIGVEIEDARKKLDNIHLDLIAVISLFSGVIIAFFGGLNYISSAISSASSADLWKLILICSVAGFITLNIIFTMLYLASRILGKDIGVYCHKGKIHGSCAECNSKCWSISIVMRRQPYIFWTDFIILVIGILVTVKIIFF